LICIKQLFKGVSATFKTNTAIKRYYLVVQVKQLAANPVKITYFSNNQLQVTIKACAYFYDELY